MKLILQSLLLWLTLTSTASATLLASLSSRDLYSPGDGLLTYDSQSNLEWLDATETRHWSIADFEADSGPFGSFRWATFDELVDLFLYVSSYARIGSHSFAFYNDAELLARGSEFVDLIGSTHPSRKGVRGMTLDYGNIGARFITAHVTVVPTSNQATFFQGPRGENNWNDDVRGEGIGLWLVREPVAVPEPSTLALFAFFIGLFYGRKSPKVR